MTTPQRIKNLEVVTPKSSVKSSKNWSERRGSFYFPGCRKDMNCNCEICVASINATLDLMPKSSLTKLSISRPKIQRSPVPFPLSPQFEPKSTAFKRERGDLGFRVYLVRFLLGLILVCGVFNSRLSPEIVKNLAEISRIHQTLNGRHLFFNNGNKFSTCRCADSVWKVNQWSSREGNYSVCTANSSPEQEKWSYSVSQFDPNTWILEYRQSFQLENSKSISATLMFLKVRLTRGFEKFKKELCKLQSALFRQRSNILVPT